MNSIDLGSQFMGLDSSEMSDFFTTTLYSTLSSNIPNKVVKCNNKDAPWVTHEIKTAIRRKHRVYKKFLQRGRKLEDWVKVKSIRKKNL